MKLDTQTRAPYTPTVTSPPVAASNAMSTTTVPPMNTPPASPVPPSLPTPPLPQGPPANALATEKLAAAASINTSNSNADSSSANQRLVRSRQLLQAALNPHTDSHKTSTASPQQASGGASNISSSAGLSSIPGLSLGLEAAKFWWSRHPLRKTGVLLATAANAYVKPIAQRKPITLVAGAFVVGGLLAWARPWRLVIKPILFAGVMPQVVSAVFTHLSNNSSNNNNKNTHRSQH